MNEVERRQRMIARLGDARTRKLLELLPTRVVVQTPVLGPGESATGSEGPEGLESALVGGTLTSLSAPSSTSMTAAVRGPLVRAGQANLNGAYFATEDLKYGLQSIAGSPLTVNHMDYAVGWVETAELSSQPDLGDYIDVSARIWHLRFASIWSKTETALSSSGAALSMECIPSQIGCMSEGCGVETATMDQACDHIRRRSAPRRMIQPVFVGAALVLPPEKPGWPDARLSRI